MRSRGAPWRTDDLRRTASDTVMRPGKTAVQEAVQGDVRGRQHEAHVSTRAHHGNAREEGSEPRPNVRVVVIGEDHVKLLAFQLPAEPKGLSKRADGKKGLDGEVKGGRACRADRFQHGTHLQAGHFDVATALEPPAQIDDVLFPLPPWT